MTIRKWTQALKDIAAPFGGTVERGTKHICIRLPNGRKVFTSLTPSDHRVLKNTKSQVRFVANGGTCYHGG